MNSGTIQVIRESRATTLLVALGCIALAVTVLGTRAAPPGSVGARVVALKGMQLDLNRATAAELELLPDIGPALAARIVADRAERGPFRDVKEIDRVRGIGPSKLASLAPHLVVAPPERSP